MKSRYLGDGVYAAVERGMIKLTVGSHLEEHATGVIFLEEEVYDALVKYHDDSIEFYKSNRCGDE